MRSMLTRVFSFLIFVTISFHVFGQGEGADVFRSPYEAVYNHLRFLQEDEYNPTQASKSLAKAGFNQQQLEQLSIELKQILDGSGNFIRLEELPKSPLYKDSLTLRSRYILTQEFPDIYVQKVGNNWRFSERTVLEIDKIHKEVYPFGTHKLLNLLPQLGSNKYFGLHLWQYIGILFLLIIGFFIYFIINFFLKNLLVRLMRKFGKVGVARNVIIPAAKPMSLLLVSWVAAQLIKTLQLPPAIGTNLILLAFALVPLFGTIFFYKLVDIASIYFTQLAEKSENTLDDQLVPLLRKVLKVFVLIVGFVAILNAFKFDIWPLLTGLSIGGLAFALAAQDTLKNFFGSLMIFIDKPFQIGDWITSGDVDGTVEEVGFRATRIRTFRDSVLYVPNSMLSNSNVDNHGLRQYRRFYTKLSITYDSPARLIEVFVKGVEQIVLKHPETRKDYYNIFLNDYAASSLDVMLYIFFEVPTWTDELRCRQEIMLEVNKLAEHLGVRFAFPTQTLHVEQMPGQLLLSPNYSESKEQMEKELEGFFDKNKK